MIKNKYLNEKIEILNLDKIIIEILNQNSIITIYDLWILSRSNLKNMGLADVKINQIIIKLQLIGLDLNKRVYN